MPNLNEISKDRIETLSREAMAKFCEGYGMMFDMGFSQTFESETTGTLDSLTAECGSIFASNTVICSGNTEGKFVIMLDRTALFTLGGATVMQPPMRIKENCSKGTLDDALQIADAVSEIGNLIVGEFNIIFRIGAAGTEGLGDSEHLILDLPVLIGNEIGAIKEELDQCSILTFNMNLTGFDPFKIRVAFPA